VLHREHRLRLDGHSHQAAAVPVVYIEVPRKNAKALALDARIATPGGWKTISDIAAGDVVPFDAEGLPTAVLATSEVFANHECSLTFSNGDSVVADAGHIWRTEAKVNQVGVWA
jgi:replicative DNA helicase